MVSGEREVASQRGEKRRCRTSRTIYGGSEDNQLIATNLRQADILIWTHDSESCRWRSTQISAVVNVDDPAHCFIGRVPNPHNADKPLKAEEYEEL